MTRETENLAVLVIAMNHRMTELLKLLDNFAATGFVDRRKILDLYSQSMVDGVIHKESDYKKENENE